MGRLILIGAGLFLCAFVDARTPALRHVRGASASAGARQRRTEGMGAFGPNTDLSTTSPFVEKAVVNNDGNVKVVKKPKQQKQSVLGSLEHGGRIGPEGGDAAEAAEVDGLAVAHEHARRLHRDVDLLARAGALR